jgi:transcriptional regulator with XRE-family HTH domain
MVKKMAFNPEKLKWARKQSFLTQKELANLAEVDQARISDWERGKSVPKVDQLCRLCFYTGVTINGLFSEEVVDGQTQTAKRAAG